MYKCLFLLIFLNSIYLAANEKVLPIKKISVVTTLSVLKKLSEEIGREKISVSSLLTADEDPHTIVDRPMFKRLVASADLFIKIGRSLEIWADQVINSAQNPKMLVINASDQVISLEVPSKISRQGGDVHPEGNPHVWLSPSASLKMAENIKDALVKLSPTNKAYFEENYKNFKKRLSEAFFGKKVVETVNNDDFLWRLHQGKRLLPYLATKKLSPEGFLKEASLIDYPFITYHNGLSYLAHDFNLKIISQIEEKPGILPSLRYLNSLKKLALDNKVKHIVVEAYYRGNKNIIDKFSKDIEGQSLLLTVDCKNDESYINFIARLLRELKNFKGK